MVAGYLGVEGANMVSKVEDVDELYEAGTHLISSNECNFVWIGVRIMSPAHFFDNVVGGSAHGEEKVWRYFRVFWVTNVTFLVWTDGTGKAGD